MSREALVASALCKLLAADDGLTVTVRDAPPERWRDLVHARAGSRPPVILYDVPAAYSDSIAAVAAATRHHPGVKVVAVTAADSLEAVPALLDAGVSGIVGRDAAPEELIRAVTEVAAGHVFASRRMLREIMGFIARRSQDRRAVAGSDADMLAPRERDVVRMLTRGMTNREIASSLHLSEATVKAHLGRVMAKWSVRDRLQVALRAIGWSDSGADVPG